MEVSQAISPADDHNTNQNEATIMCRPTALSSDTICQEPSSLNKVADLGLIISENADTQDNSKGMSTPVNITNQKPVECNRIIDAVNEYPQTNTVENAISIENKPCGVELTDVGDQLSANNVLTGDTPNQKVLDVSNTSHDSPNEYSNVDISVTSDDDVKVTCRLSSTPNSYSIHKALNESDCSMSSVGEASPISSTEHSKMAPINEQCQILHNNDALHANKEEDKIDKNIIYLQPQIYSSTTNDNRIHSLKQDQTPKCNLYYVDRNQTSCTPTFQQNYTDHTMRYYPGSPYEYNSLLDNQCGFNDYNLCDQRSFTDVKLRPEVQPINISPQPDVFGYPLSPSVTPERDYFVYPSIYVSNAGLISVLLRNDMSVEMTVDRTIRVVSHNHMMAVATDSKGTAASLYHPAAKIFQMGYNTDISTDTFRAKITQGEAIFFSNGANCFKLQDAELKPMAPIKFSDINRDQSVNLLFSSEGYGESLVATCMQVAAQAEYANLPKGGVIVRINGVKVTQSGCGDVTVVTGAKFIRLSPHNGTTRLGNRFIDIEVERDWSVKLTRGTHSFVTNKKRTMVSNGKMEAGFDENNCLKVINLQPRHPLIAEPNIIRRPGKRITRTPPSSVPTFFTPRRRVVTPVSGRGGINSC